MAVHKKKDIFVQPEIMRRKLHSEHFAFCSVFFFLLFLVKAKQDETKLTVLLYLMSRVYIFVIFI